MNKKFLVTCLSVLFVSWGYAQEDVTDSIEGEAVDMPEGILVSEDELMSDYTNATNLTAGTGTSRVLSYSDSVLVSRLSRIPTTIDLPLNDVTRKYIDTYSTRMKNSVAIMLGSSNFYNPIFEEALERHGLPLELKYLPVIESGLRPTATSPVGAAGLWQFMLATGKRYGLEVNTLVDERRDPIKASEAAAQYLSRLYGMFGDWSLAIAAYNCGEGNVQKALIRSGNQDGADFWSIYDRLPRETRGYVPAFIAATYIMNYYCEHGIVPHEASLPLESDTVVVQRDVKFSQIAAKCNITIDELRAINPQYRKDIVQADYVLRLPAGTVEEFLVKEDSIYGVAPGSGAFLSSTRRSVVSDVEEAPVERAAATTTTTSRSYTSSSRSNASSSRSSKTKTRSTDKKSRSSRDTRSRKQKTQSVSVKSGDTLSSIAKKNGTTVSKLKKMNGLKGDMIHPGQSVRVK